MAWANVSNVLTANVDSATDNPADAREDIRKAFIELQTVINGRGTINGVASLDSSTKVPASQLPTPFVSTSGDITLQPSTARTSFEDVINLEPVDYASLPATPSKGDVAYLTTDGAAASKEQLVFYNGSGWKYVADPTGLDVAAS
jgi:hypothetical protein